MAQIASFLAMTIKTGGFTHRAQKLRYRNAPCLRTSTFELQYLLMAFFAFFAV